MKYPYIGKGEDSGNVVLFSHENYGRCIHGVTCSTGMSGQWSEFSFTNITREYLEGKCVKIESPEHEKLLIALAENAGFKRLINKNYRDYIRFYHDGDWTYSSESNVALCGKEIIKIPLPPKKEFKFPSAPQHIDCMCNKCGGRCCLGFCDKDKADEWQIGDVVEYPSGKGVLTISDPDNQGIVIVMETTDDLGSHYKRVGIESLKKPKTEAEMLRDELMEMAVTAMSNEDFDLDHNCYYLISGLMKKYSIKPQ